MELTADSIDHHHSLFLVFVFQMTAKRLVETSVVEATTVTLFVQLGGLFLSAALVVPIPSISLPVVPVKHML